MLEGKEAIGSLYVLQWRVEGRYGYVGARAYKPVVEV